MYILLVFIKITKLLLFFSPFYQSSIRASTSKNAVMANFDGLVTPNMTPEDMSKNTKLRENVYKKFNFFNKPQNNLSIMDSREEILDKIESHTAVVIQGSTGCGKTTQVPQFILDKARDCNEYCNIVVTQPRRIAAISIAKRVCKERKWELGTLVGFQVRLLIYHIYF